MQKNCNQYVPIHDASLSVILYGLSSDNKTGKTIAENPKLMLGAKVEKFTTNPKIT